MEWLKTKDHIYIHDKRGLDNLTPNMKNKVLGKFIYTSILKIGFKILPVSNFLEKSFFKYILSI